MLVKTSSIKNTTCRWCGTARTSPLHSSPLCVENEMMDIFAKIVHKNRAIWFVAILLIIYNVLRLFAVIGPPYVIAQIANIDGGISLAEYQVAFISYINEASENLQMAPTILKLSLFYSGLISLAYILFSLYLGMRKKFAKYIVTCLLFIEIVIAIVTGLKQSTLPSIDSTLIAIFILLFLFSPNLAKAFD